MILVFNLCIYKLLNDIVIDKKKNLVILFILIVYMIWEDCMYYEYDEYK